jgi:hypothetical protein
VRTLVVALRVSACVRVCDWWCEISFFVLAVHALIRIHTMASSGCRSDADPCGRDDLTYVYVGTAVFGACAVISILFILMVEYITPLKRLVMGDEAMRIFSLRAKTKSIQSAA